VEGSGGGREHQACQVWHARAAAGSDAEINRRKWMMRRELQTPMQVGGGVEDEEGLEEATTAEATALLAIAIETSGAVSVEEAGGARTRRTAWVLGPGLTTAISTTHHARRHDRDRDRVVQSGPGCAAHSKCMGSEGCSGARAPPPTSCALFSSLVGRPNFPKPPKTFQSGWSCLV
jgi:hypothetical protein